MSDATKQHKAVRDDNGREVKPGDIIRVFHYIDGRTRRKCYMYKLVVLVDGDCKVSPDGKHLYCVSISDIWETGRLNAAHKCHIDFVGAFEVIGGLGEIMPSGELQVWYERPKQKESAQ